MREIGWIAKFPCICTHNFGPSVMTMCTAQWDPQYNADTIGLIHALAMRECVQHFSTESCENLRLVCQKNLKAFPKIIYVIRMGKMWQIYKAIIDYQNCIGDCSSFDVRTKDIENIVVE